MLKENIVSYLSFVKNEELPYFSNFDTATVAHESKSEAS